MKRKFLCILLIILCILSLTSCDFKPKSEGEKEIYTEEINPDKPLKLSEKEWLELISQNPVWLDDRANPMVRMAMIFDQDGSLYLIQASGNYFSLSGEAHTWEYSKEDKTLKLFGTDLFQAYSYKGQTAIVPTSSLDIATTPTPYIPTTGYTSKCPDGYFASDIVGEWYADEGDNSVNQWEFCDDGRFLTDTDHPSGPTYHKWIMTDEDILYILYSPSSNAIWEEMKIARNDDGSIFLSSVINKDRSPIKLYK